MKKQIKWFLILFAFAYLSAAVMYWDVFWISDLASWTPPQRLGAWYYVFCVPLMASFISRVWK